MTSKNLTPGMTAAPCVLTFAAQVVLAVISRSVAAIRSAKPSASNRKWESMGIVALLSRALRTNLKCSKSSDLSTKKSMLKPPIISTRPPEAMGARPNN